MTVTSRDPARHSGGSAVRRWMHWGLLLATLVGLVVMHQLAGARDPGSTSHAVSMTAAAEIAEGHCSAPDGGCQDGGREVNQDHHREHDRDDPRHGHAGQVCQFTPPAGGPVSTPVLVVTPGGVASTPMSISPRTAIGEAANGSGCGPPSLFQLSIFRI
ncbi:DUF6153 family protein [Micromonospora polyrhachis]|uniref:Uncharacterized protein n=1 Tax=Micromonospora polyrhachis TaxID=1282883 RepID=A0A7W7SRY4_9ACTN|nr:DUF6153 family protein [Micromonospora polyrhachis]MBB4959848.1 hypothetical protein [Micromonospora polyrhachis]